MELHTTVDGTYCLLGLTEVDLINVDIGLHLQIEKYKESIGLHDDCGQNYKEPCRLSPTQTCNEDLMFLYGSIGSIYRILFEMGQKK